MVRLEDQMNNENLEMLQQIFEVCKLFQHTESFSLIGLARYPVTYRIFEHLLSVTQLWLQRCSCCKFGGGGGTPYNGLYGEAPPERGTLFRLEVHKRVGISQVEV